MTVIAWDGRILAADKQVTISGMRQPVTKIYKINDSLTLAFSGSQCESLDLMEWYLKGCDPLTWPAYQKVDDFTRIIVVTDGQLYYYESLPVLIRHEGRLMAFGCGRDYAIGAMAAGANAIEAVEIANQFSEGCGFGVNFVNCAIGDQNDQ